MDYSYLPLETRNDRRDRLGWNYTEIDSDKFGYWFNNNRSTKFTMRSNYHKYESSELQECELCNRKSTKKRIHDRGTVYGWDQDSDDPWKPSKTRLCMSCWNKVQPIKKAQNEAQEIKYLKNKLYREALKWQKLTTQAN